MSALEASPARRGLVWLLERYPHLELVEADWQGWNMPRGDARGPWLLVTLGQESSSAGDPDVFALWPFAIFKRTGAVHRIDGGAVSDDPFFVP